MFLCGFFVDVEGRKVLLSRLCDAKRRRNCLGRRFVAGGSATLSRLFPHRQEPGRFMGNL